MADADDPVGLSSVGDGPVDIRKVRAAIGRLIKELSFAADAHRVPATSAIRLMNRMFTGVAEMTADLLCELVREVRVACSDLEETRKRAVSTVAVAHAANRRAVRICGWMTALGIVVTVLNPMLTSWLKGRHPETNFEVDFGDGDNGLIECGVGGKDAAGAYHCNMKVVLRPRKGR